MKTKMFFSLVISFFVATAVIGAGKGGNLSGSWKLNREKTVLENNQLFLAKISIKLKADSLFTVRTYETASYEQYPFNENLTMDGKEYKIVIYDMPRKSKAYWAEQDGSLVIESTTTFYGNSGEDNFMAKENWTVNDEGTELKFEFTGKSSTGESKGTYYFKKDQ